MKNQSTNTNKEAGLLKNQSTNTNKEVRKPQNPNKRQASHTSKQAKDLHTRPIAQKQRKEIFSTSSLQQSKIYIFQDTSTLKDTQDPITTSHAPPSLPSQDQNV